MAGWIRGSWFDRPVQITLIFPRSIGCLHASIDFPARENDSLGIRTKILKRAHAGGKLVNYGQTKSLIASKIIEILIRPDAFAIPRRLSFPRE